MRRDLSFGRVDQEDHVKCFVYRNAGVMENGVTRYRFFVGAFATTPTVRNMTWIKMCVFALFAYVAIFPLQLC